MRGPSRITDFFRNLLRVKGDTAIDRILHCAYSVAMRKPQGSRTRTPRKQRKDDEVRMRVTEEQKRTLVDAAAREGLDLSAWLRQLALRAAGVLPAARED